MRRQRKGGQFKRQRLGSLLLFLPFSAAGVVPSVPEIRLSAMPRSGHPSGKTVSCAESFQAEPFCPPGQARFACFSDKKQAQSSHSRPNPKLGHSTPSAKAVPAESLTARTNVFRPDGPEPENKPEGDRDGSLSLLFMSFARDHPSWENSVLRGAFPGRSLTARTR